LPAICVFHRQEWMTDHVGRDQQGSQATHQRAGG
jgi:hypothetical protein